MRQDQLFHYKMKMFIHLQNRNPHFAGSQFYVFVN